jgi:hypothetical protein
VMCFCVRTRGFNPLVTNISKGFYCPHEILLDLASSFLLKMGILSQNVIETRVNLLSHSCGTHSTVTPEVRC